MVINICKMGHYFNDSFDECPYCDEEYKTRNNKLMIRQMNLQKVNDKLIQKDPMKVVENDDRTELI